MPLYRPFPPPLLESLSVSLPNASSANPNSVKPQLAQTNTDGNKRTEGLFKASNSGKWMFISAGNSRGLTDWQFLQATLHPFLPFIATGNS